MSRLMLMFLFVIWLSWRTSGSPDMDYLPARLAMFLGFYGLVVGVLAAWARQLSCRLLDGDLHRGVARFNRIVDFARWMVPIWFGVGVYILGWGDWMQQLFPPAVPGGPAALSGWQLPAVVVGILPGVVTWMSLWWATFPADRALREQNLLHRLDADLPVIAPPRLRDYVASNFRMQVLFICMPLLLVIGARDLFAFAWQWSGRALNENIEALIAVAAMAIVFTLAPVMLTRVLPTEPLPPSSLRRRLEEMCRRAGLKYRQILLWHTHQNIVNAGVMGLFSRVRYILLSDALLESMHDEQIEAVFAHELGHVVHRHMVWYVIFFIVCGACWGGLMNLLPVQIRYGQEIAGIGGFVFFFTCFGLISRRCERQADVYAARLMETLHGGIGIAGGRVYHAGDLLSPLSPVIAGAPLTMLAPIEAADVADEVLPVGRTGARIFNSALDRVAAMNNIPTRRFEWLHGSIGGRMDFIRDLAAHPRYTKRFDRQMRRLYALLLMGLMLSLLWGTTTLVAELRASTPGNSTNPGLSATGL